nr:GtrA family protein [Gemmobacter straminiformis]
MPNEPIRSELPASLMAALQGLSRATSLPLDFLLYGCVGALGAAVHFSLLAVLLNGLGLPFLPSHTAVTFAVMVLNFVLNNRFTFPGHRLHGRAFAAGLLRFCLISSLGALINVAAAYITIRLAPFWPLATLVGIAAGTVWNYRLSKRHTWKAH